MTRMPRWPPVERPLRGRSNGSGQSTGTVRVRGWTSRHQWFLKTPLQPVNGVITLPETPGLGMDLDDAKIEEQRPLSWAQTRWS